jgi:hypothetical protein
MMALTQNANAVLVEGLHPARVGALGGGGAFSQGLQQRRRRSAQVSARTCINGGVSSAGLAACAGRVDVAPRACVMLLRSMCTCEVAAATRARAAAHASHSHISM